MSEIINPDSSQNNQLYSVAKRYVQQRAERVSKPVGYGLGGEAQEAGQGHNGDGIHGEDEAGRGAIDLADGDADGHKGKQHIQFGVHQDGLGIVPDALEYGSLWFLLLLVAASPYDSPRLRSLR